MKTAVEMLQALHYKLRWFGVPIDGPVNVFGDNESVINSSQKPEATLSKKHNSIALDGIPSSFIDPVVMYKLDNLRFPFFDTNNSYAVTNYAAVSISCYRQVRIVHRRISTWQCNTRIIVLKCLVLFL
jgi:hypothetical protein